MRGAGRQTSGAARRAGVIAAATALALALTSAPDAFATDLGAPAGAGAATGRDADVEALAFDATGNLYVAGLRRDRVVVLGADGAVAGEIGAGRLDGPTGIAIAADGDVLVADRAGVQRYAANGALLAAWPAARPAGIAAAPDGSVYVSEPDRVARFSPAGAPAGGFAADRPRGIAVAADGSVWVAVAGALAHVAADGTPITATPADDAHGVAVAPDGTVLVAERERDRVTRVTSAGVAADAVAGTFDDPRGVAVDCRGNVAVADESRARIHRIAAGPPPPCVAGPAALVPATPERPVARRLAASPAPAPALIPVLGRTALAATVSGRVQVRVPGVEGVLPAQVGSLLPFGTRIDTRDGRVQLAFATRTADFDALGTRQAGVFSSGVFSIHQRRAASLVEVRLAGGPPGCGDAGDARSDAPRRLWAEVRGRVRARGALATVTARSARWLTEDRCDGTHVRVTRGTVRVRDLVRGRVVRVRAGGRCVVRPAAGG